MVKSAVLVWFILLAGKPVGMTFEKDFTSITACMLAASRAHTKAAELKETGVDIEVYTSCEQDRQATYQLKSACQPQRGSHSALNGPSPSSSLNFNTGWPLLPNSIATTLTLR